MSHVACSYEYQVLGQLAADDGAVGVACSVAVRWSTPNATPDRCRLAGTPWQEFDPVIPLGGTFRCSVSGNVARAYELQVRCPGCALLDQPFAVEGCTALFSNCDDIQLGTLVLRREP